MSDKSIKELCGSIDFGGCVLPIDGEFEVVPWEFVSNCSECSFRFDKRIGCHTCRDRIEWEIEKKRREDAYER